MISELKDQDNMMPLYKDLIPNLRDYKISSACPWVKFARIYNNPYSYWISM